MAGQAHGLSSPVVTQARRHSRDARKDGADEGGTSPESNVAAVAAVGAGTPEGARGKAAASLQTDASASDRAPPHVPSNSSSQSLEVQAQA